MCGSSSKQMSDGMGGGRFRSGMLGGVWRDLPAARFAHVLFDLDGTIANSQLGIVRCLQHGFAECGLPVPPEGELVAIIGPPFSIALKRFELDDATVAKVIEAYRARYLPIGMYEAEIYPGVGELVHHLHQRGVVVALATSKPEPFAERIVEHFGVRDALTVVAGATFDDVRSAKADVVAHALAQLPAADASNTVMVGDREHDILGAAAHGLRAIGVTWGFGERRELEAAGAWAVVDDAAALEALLLDGER